MSKYPDLLSGQRFTAAVAASIVPDIIVKTAVTDRASTTTLAADPELQGLALGIGTWWVRVCIFATTPTTSTQKIKTQWGFTGTWNSPIRMCIGPGSTNTAARTDVTPAQYNGVATSSDATYSFAASTGFNTFTEECFAVTVTVAGTMSFNWAQSASSANVTSVKPGSSIMAKQILA